METWLTQTFCPFQLQDLEPKCQDVMNTEISRAAHLTTLAQEVISIEEPGLVPPYPTEAETGPLLE